MKARKCRKMLKMFMYLVSRPNIYPPPHTWLVHALSWARPHPATCTISLCPFNFFNISYYFSRGIRKTTYVGYGAPPISIIILIIFCNTFIHNNIHVIGLGNKLLVLSCLVFICADSCLEKRELLWYHQLSLAQ